MGYRWYKGRLLSDEEYSDKKVEELQSTWLFIAFMIPIVSLGSLAWYFFHNSTAVIISISIGIILVYIFRDLIYRLSELLPIIVGAAVIIGILVFIFLL